MSENLDPVRSINAAWKRGDFSSVEWAHPEIELVFADGPSPGTWKGLAAMRATMREYLSTWQNARLEAEEYRELDRDRVLVVDHEYGRGKTSRLDTSDVRATGANVFYVRDGSVARLVVYLARESAFADLGLATEGDAA
jgi:ketosteroid isomerase-like protein